MFGTVCARIKFLDFSEKIKIYHLEMLTKKCVSDDFFNFFLPQV